MDLLNLAFEKMDVYIAAGFFNPASLALVTEIEGILSKEHVRFFSPRLEGKVLKDLPESEREKAGDEAFHSNIQGLIRTNLLLHVLDDKDEGAAWESGFWTGTKGIKNVYQPIVTFHSKSKPLNIMYQKVAFAHLRSLEDLENFIINFRTFGFHPTMLKYPTRTNNLT